MWLENYSGVNSSHFHPKSIVIIICCAVRLFFRNSDNGRWSSSIFNTTTLIFFFFFNSSLLVTFQNQGFNNKSSPFIPIIINLVNSAEAAWPPWNQQNVEGGGGNAGAAGREDGGGTSWGIQWADWEINEHQQGALHQLFPHTLQVSQAIYSYSPNNPSLSRWPLSSLQGLISRSPPGWSPGIYPPPYICSTIAASENPVWNCGTQFSVALSKV